MYGLAIIFISVLVLGRVGTPEHGLKAGLSFILQPGLVLGFVVGAVRLMLSTWGNWLLFVRL